MLSDRRLQVLLSTRHGTIRFLLQFGAVLFGRDLVNPQNETGFFGGGCSCKAMTVVTLARMTRRLVHGFMATGAGETVSRYEECRSRGKKVGREKCRCPSES